MRILYLSNKPLYPTVDGGCKAMVQMLKCLMACEYSIDHVALSTAKHPFNVNCYPEEIRCKIRVQHIFLETQVNPVAALKALLSGKSYNISRFDFSLAHDKMRELLSSKEYDIVFLESLYTTPYIKTIRACSKAKIILRTHNVEHALWEQRSRAQKPGLKKWYLSKLARDLKKYELEAIRSVDKVLSLSSSDAKFFETVLTKEKVSVVPVSLEQQTIKASYHSNAVFYLGSMNWHPNYQAANILVNKIFPEIRSALPDTTLHLAGSFMSERFPTNSENGIFNHGYVEDINQFMTSSGIMVLPIRSGSGIRIKILEAMALGIPIVTFPEGAQGIETADGLIVVTNEEEMISSLIDLLQNENERLKLGDSARKYVQSQLSHTQITTQLRHELSNL